jgi:hypothetical protein
MWLDQFGNSLTDVQAGQLERARRRRGWPAVPGMETPDVLVECPREWPLNWCAWLTTLKPSPVSKHEEQRRSS